MTNDERNPNDETAEMGPSRKFDIRHSLVIRHSALIASINTSGSACFRYDYFNQHRELWFKSFPDPNSHVLAGGVRESRDFVQIIVVELFPDGLKDRRDVSVIHHPAELRITFTRNYDLDFEAVAMQPPALMRLGQTRQQMGGFKLEGFS